MARIAGIDIPKGKRGVISLTYIYGIGRSQAASVLDRAGVDQSKKVEEWSDEEAPGDARDRYWRDQHSHRAEGLLWRWRLHNLLNKYNSRTQEDTIIVDHFF